MLAKAVSDAGAFGVLGFDEDESEHAIGSQLALVSANKATAFNIGLVAWVLEKRSTLLDLAINARPKLISVSFGDISPSAVTLFPYIVPYNGALPPAYPFTIPRS